MVRAILLLAALLPAATFAAPLLLVGNKGENSLSIVNLDNGRELRRLETGKAPHEIAVSPDGRRAAVVAYGGTSIDIFDLVKRERLRSIELGANARPHGIVWLGDGRIVATAEGRRSIAVVAKDLATVREIATGQDGTHMVAVSPDGGRAYTANMGSGSVSIIDLEAGRKLHDVPAGKVPEGIALSRDGRRLWVADRDTASLQVFDSATMRRLATLPTGKAPIRVAVSPDGALTLTSNFGDGTLSLFDSRSFRPLRTIAVGAPGGQFQQVTVLFSPDGKRLYVAETGIDRIAEVDLERGEVLGRLPAGRNGDGLAIVR